MIMQILLKKYPEKECFMAELVSTDINNIIYTCNLQAL